MRKIGVVLWLPVLLLSLNGCVTRIGLKDPISFAPISGPAIPIHLGIVLPDGAETYSLKKRGYELLVGDAVRQNIGNSLQSIFKTVTVSTNAANLPSTVDKVAFVRFGPGTRFYLPLTIFQEIKVTVVLNFEVYNGGKTLIWKTTCQGTKTGYQPPSMEITLIVGAINSFYRDLMKDSVKAALDDLNNQINAEGKNIMGNK